MSPSTAFTPDKELLQASDADIQQRLEHGHIPALMCALVHLTGNIDLIRGSIQPHPVMMGNPNQSITAEDRTKIQELAFDIIVKLRDGELTPQSLLPEHIQEMIQFITGEHLSLEYTRFALAELGLNDENAYTVEGFDAIDTAKRQDFRVAIVGAGMSGILAAIRLKEAGIPFVVFEKNSDVGGTWFENRYPGCRVDSPNHVYSYSFAPKDWPQHFSDQSVLLEYFKDVTEKFDLRSSIRFGSEVESMRYSEETGEWQIQLATENGNEDVSVNAVIVAVGQLNRPKLPDIPGKEKFSGPSFHSAQWDESVDLKNKNIAIIGTGASAFQFTPHVVREARKVDVFLRTPPWVAINPLYQSFITDEKHWLLNNIPFYATWFRFSMFWTSGEGLLSMARCEPNWEGQPLSVSQANQSLRFMLTNSIETQLANRPDLVAKLIPNYPPAAKRMLIDDGTWYKALQDDKVTVINEPIESITPSGLQLSDGTDKNYDVILYGTGFYANQFLYPMKIYGADGTELRERWGADPRAYLGITIPNYPNMYTLYGPNTNIVVNGSIIFFSECEMLYVMQCIRHLLENGLSAMDCKQTVHDDYNVQIDKDNLWMAWGASTVNAWYKNENGRVTQCWPGTLMEFWQQCRDFDPEAYEWTKATNAVGS